MSAIEYTDSHVHLDMEAFDQDRASVLTRANDAGVKTMVNIALGPEKERLERALTLTKDQPSIFLTMGIHPHESEKMTQETLPMLKKLASNNQVVALGEIGLDYHYNHSPQEIQKQRFGELLDLALSLKLPVTIHSRNAFQDTYDALASRNVFQKVGGVLHCFTYGKKEAQQFLDLGAYISFSGILTFKKAEELREAAKMVPLDRILIETDAPYLTPEPYRGKRNEPSFVIRVAEVLAQVKGMSVEEIAQITSSNTKKVFRIN